MSYESLVRRSKAARAREESGDLPLFAPVRPEPCPVARRTDPWTSHAAAASVGDSAAHQRAAIRKLLADYPDGLTNDELDTLLGWRVGTASRRTAEMGDLVREGSRATRTGRQALVLRLPSCGNF